MLRRCHDGLRARPWVTALSLAVCALALPSALRASGAALVGQVISEGGGAIGTIVKVQVELPTGDLVKQVTTSPDGRFQFLGLDQMAYRVRAIAPGFETAVRDADFNGPINEIFLRIVLQPARPQKIAPPKALSDERASRKARKEFARGDRALKKNKLDEARAHLEQAVQEFPCYARAQTDLALVDVREEKIPAAEAALRKSISCDADFLDAYGWLAVILNGTARYKESQKILEEALRRAPELWNLHYLMGEACVGLNQYDKAKDEYLQVSSLNSSPPAELHARLGDLLEKMGDYEDAYAEMQAYLNAEPQGRFAVNTRAVMAGMVSAGLVQPAAVKPAASSLPKN